tara:strand:+ start:211 stop:807 length:597 start_codon:yes stop_codon:yes gene_type:complete
MGITLSSKNLFLFISYISPFLLGFTFIFLGFINSEPLKPLLYLGSLLFTMGIVVFLLKFNTSSTPSLNPLCSVFTFMDDEYYRPNISTYFITFTLFYCVMPMILSHETNYYFLSLILFVLVGDTVTKLSYGCVNMMGIVTSIVTGTLIGTLSGLALYYTNNELVFFGGKSSNNVSCSKPSKQNFKCVVYKNGQILKSL